MPSKKQLFSDEQREKFSDPELNFGNLRATPVDQSKTDGIKYYVSPGQGAIQTYRPKIQLHDVRFKRHFNAETSMRSIGFKKTARGGLMLTTIIPKSSNKDLVYLCQKAVWSSLDRLNPNCSNNERLKTLYGDGTKIYNAFSYEKVRPLGFVDPSLVPDNKITGSYRSFFGEDDDQEGWMTVSFFFSDTDKQRTLFLVDEKNRALGEQRDEGRLVYPKDGIPMTGQDPIKFGQSELMTKMFWNASFWVELVSVEFVKEKIGVNAQTGGEEYRAVPRFSFQLISDICAQKVVLEEDPDYLNKEAVDSIMNFSLFSRVSGAKKRKKMPVKESHESNGEDEITE